MIRTTPSRYRKRLAHICVNPHQNRRVRRALRRLRTNQTAGVVGLDVLNSQLAQIEYLQCNVRQRKANPKPHPDIPQLNSKSGSWAVIQRSTGYRIGEIFRADDRIARRVNFDRYALVDMADYLVAEESHLRYYGLTFPYSYRVRKRIWNHEFFKQRD